MRPYLVLAAMLIGACSIEPQPPLVATELVITRPMPGTGMSAGYLSLTNNTEQTINITRVASPQFASVQLHESMLENGVARMRAIPELEIPAGETVALQRGGKHLMLMRPTGPADVVSLQFFDDDHLVLSVDAGFETRVQ